VRWLWIAVLMERGCNLNWILRFVLDQLQEFDSFILLSSTHIMPQIRIEHFELLNFVIIAFKFDLFSQAIGLGWIALLHNHLDDIFSLKLLLFEDRYVLYNDLNIE
jgi:hypothetical protein